MSKEKRIILNFMDVEPIKSGDSFTWADAPYYYVALSDYEKTMESIANYSKYDTDWNWLMKVVEKIENITHAEDLFFNVTIGYGLECTIFSGESDLYNKWSCGNSKIHSVFLAVVEFIEWYNEWSGKHQEIREILERKRNGIDCTEDESAEIKGWLTDTLLMVQDGSTAIEREIQVLFPQEYGEYLGETEDLFDDYENLPSDVTAILEKYEDLDNSYDECAALVADLGKIGYTCEYGLDGIPHSLRKL